MLENILGFYENRPFIYHIHRILLNFILYIILFILTIFIPIHYGHYLFPYLVKLPLKFRFSKTISDIEKSVELLVSHLLLPLLVERSQGDFVEKLVKYVLGIYARVLKIGGILNPIVFPWVRAEVIERERERVVLNNGGLNNGGLREVGGELLPVEGVANPATTTSNNNNNNSNNVDGGTGAGADGAVVQHKWYNVLFNIDMIPYGVRIMTLVLLSMVSLAIVYSCALHLPLALGRAIVHTVRYVCIHLYTHTLYVGYVCIQRYTLY